MKNVVVIGSINMDTVIKLERFPSPGETLHGLDQFKFPGGKGLNQATALSRLGNKVTLIGMIGQDKEGQALLKCLENEGVDIRFIGVDEQGFTGNALILVDKNGNNEIIVLHGANKKVDPKFVETYKKILADAKMLLLQFEVPLETVEYLINQAKNLNVPVVVNPSPFYPIQDQLIRKIDYLVLNEVEASQLLDKRVETITDAFESCRLIQSKGAQNVVLTLGEQGAVFSDISGLQGHQPAFQISTLDSTAAGDAFLGGLLHALIKNETLANAVFFANAVGALTASKMGAQSSLPRLNEVEDFVNEIKKI